MKGTSDIDISQHMAVNNIKPPFWEAGNNVTSLELNVLVLNPQSALLILVDLTDLILLRV